MRMFRLEEIACCIKIFAIYPANIAKMLEFMASVAKLHREQ